MLPDIPVSAIQEVIPYYDPRGAVAYSNIPIIYSAGCLPKRTALPGYSAQSCTRGVPGKSKRPPIYCH